LFNHVWGNTFISVLAKWKRRLEDLTEVAGPRYGPKPMSIMCSYPARAIHNPSFSVGFLTFSSASISSTRPTLACWSAPTQSPPDIKRYSIGNLIYILFDFLVSFFVHSFLVFLDFCSYIVTIRYCIWLVTKMRKINECFVSYYVWFYSF
jgi:hypothetical protein